MAKPKAKTDLPDAVAPGSDEPLLLALACGSTVEVAAERAGLSPRTVYRRLEDPQFRRRLADYRSELVKRSSAALTAAAMEAVKTLLALMDRVIPHATRLGAARSVLELGVKLRDLTEVEERLQTIEAQLAERESAHRRHR